MMTLKVFSHETILRVILDAAQGKTVTISVPNWGRFCGAWDDLNAIFRTGAFTSAIFHKGSRRIQLPKSKGKIVFLVESVPSVYTRGIQADAQYLAGW